jgi:hypothetical protein
VRELNAIAERHVGTIVDSRHSFGSADALEALLIDAGFRDVRVNSVSHDVQFADGVLYARLNAMAAIGMTAAGKAMSDAERSELAGRIAADSQAVISGLTRNGVFVLPLATNIAVARV